MLLYIFQSEVFENKVGLTSAAVTSHQNGHSRDSFFVVVASLANRPFSNFAFAFE